MKRVVTIIVVVVSILALTLPSVAMAADVDTEAVVGGSGSAPYVCAKWETPDDRPLVPNTQIEPNPGTTKTVKFYVVVSDPNGIDDVAAVYIKTYHPDGSFKYQLDAIRPTWTLINWGGLIDMNGDCVGETSVPTALDQLDAQGRITYGFDPVRGATMTLDTLKYDLQNNKQILVELKGVMDYHQPAGLYTVEAIVVDQGGKSGVLRNLFEYLSIVALKIDFTKINWGSVNVNAWNVLFGDEDMGTPTKPTVQNIGNDPSKLQLRCTDMLGMNFFKKISRFDAKMRGGYVEFDANTNTIIVDPVTGNPVLLPPCTPTQIDFSVHPPVGTPEDVYQGTMTLTILHY